VGHKGGFDNVGCQYDGMLFPVNFCVFRGITHDRVLYMAFSESHVLSMILN
jgi:hypothetical protein